MIVIADSSALVAVSTYRGLDLLETLFGTVLVPTAVHDEVCAQGKPQADALKAYLLGKVQKVDMSQCKLQKNIRFRQRRAGSNGTVQGDIGKPDAGR